jgi:hypothetical protein
LRGRLFTALLALVPAEEMIAEVLQQVWQLLEARSEEAVLAQLFTAALRSASLPEFQEALEQA